MKQITNYELLKIQNNKAKVDKLNESINELVSATEQITGEFEGVTFDYMLNDMYTVEQLLAKLKITTK